MKYRLTYLGISASVIPIGLVARAFRSEADTSSILGFITLYLGDTLWAVMFFFLFAAACLRWSARRLALLTLIFTVGIEVSQLYRGQPLAALRDFPPTGFLLGNQFLWSDIACLGLGTMLAAGLHLALPNHRAATEE